MNNVDKRLESLSPRKRVLFEWLLKEKAKQENQASRAKHIATNYDVAILGGGLAGLTLARQIKRSRPETTIFVAEKNKYPVPEAAFKVGESTVEMGTNYLADVLGLKEHLDADQLPKAGLRFFFSTDDNRNIA